MMILWIILEVMFLLLFRELPPVETGDKQNARHKNNSQNEHQPNGQSARDDVPYQSLDDCSASMLIVQATQINSISDRSETSPLIPHLSSNRYQSCNMSSSSQRNDVLHCHRTGSHLVWLISELLREEMVVLLGILFITMFSQTTTEVRFRTRA